MNLYKYTVAFAVAAGITFGGLKAAHGELVFEDDLNNGSAAQEETSDVAQPRIEERKNLSKSEVMRRQRLREELKNEDLLTQKLEELRLRDEMKRTGDLMGSGINKQSASPDIVQEERVGSAAAQPGYNQAGAAVAGNPLNNTAVGINGAPVMTAEAQASESDSEEPTRVSVSPRGGMSNIIDSMYDVESKYSLGVTVSVDVTDHITATAGYTYSSYSLGAGQTLQYGSYAMNNLKKIELNDNIIDFGVRGNIMGPKSKLRPFVGVGFAYRKGYVNYDEQTRSYIRQYDMYGSPDVDISGFAGYVETGLEFKITKMIGLTAQFRYFNLLSSRQSGQVNPNAFYNGGVSGNPYYGSAVTNGYAYSPYNYNDGSKERAGQALSKNNFYQLMAGVTVSF